MILIDFDGVVYNTVRAFVELNNELNGLNEDYRDTVSWNFAPNCKNLKTSEEVEELFRYKKLYEKEYFYPNALEVINRLNKNYDLAICTMGDNINIINKLNLIEKYLPKINVIPVVNNNGNLNTKNNIKSTIKLDDHIKNLVSTNGEFSILFEPGKRYEWNEGWESKPTVKTWLEFERLVNEFYGRI